MGDRLAINSSGGDEGDEGDGNRSPSLQLHSGGKMCEYLGGSGRSGGGGGRRRPAAGSIRPKSLFKVPLKEIEYICLHWALFVKVK